MRYTKVPEDVEDDFQSPTQHFRGARERSGRGSALYVAIVFALIASNAMTWVLTTKGIITTRIGPRSTYAGLEYNSPELLDADSPYTDANVTLRDQMWLDIDVDDGMIALTDADVARWGLPASQRFPWDDNKSIYLLQAHHNLHCARSIYISLMEYRDGLPQSRRHHHIIHCLEALRRDVVCNADDTPRHTSSDPAHAGQTGFGQHRQCRNWDTLNDWAKQHYACFRYDHEELGASYPEIQRFVWCPEGSPYRQEVDKYFIVDYDTPRGHGII